MIVDLDISGETFVAVEEEKVYPLTCWLNWMLRDQMPSGRPQVFHRLWIHHFNSYVCVCPNAYFLCLCLERHFIPIGMDMSFHSVWNGWFIPTGMK